MDFYCPCVSTRRYFARPSTKHNSLSSRFVYPTAITFTSTLSFFHHLVSISFPLFPENLISSSPVILSLSLPFLLLFFFFSSFVTSCRCDRNQRILRFEEGSFRNVNTRGTLAFRFDVFSFLASILMEIYTYLIQTVSWNLATPIFFNVFGHVLCEIVCAKSIR